MNDPATGKSRLPVPLLPKPEGDGHATATPATISPPAMTRVASTGLISVPSAERLAVLLHRSPALSSARNLTVPGSPSSFGLSSPRRTPEDSQSQRSRATSASSRPSGAGGYSPRRRVILAELQGPGDERDEADASFAMERWLASPRTEPAPMALATPPIAGADADPKDDAWTEYLFGTAPALSAAMEGRPYLDVVNCTLRGVGQVMFSTYTRNPPLLHPPLPGIFLRWLVCPVNNPLSGLIILLALLWQSLYVPPLLNPRLISIYGPSLRDCL